MNIEPNNAEHVSTEKESCGRGNENLRIKNNILKLSEMARMPSIKNDILQSGVKPRIRNGILEVEGKKQKRWFHSNRAHTFSSSPVANKQYCWTWKERRRKRRTSRRIRSM